MHSGKPGWIASEVDFDKLAQAWANVLGPKTAAEIEMVESELPGSIIQPYLDVRAKRKEEGRCLDCGDLLPMSAMGLGDCKACNP